MPCSRVVGVVGHVFISYRHDDSAAYVERLAKHLAANAIPIWYDREIISGDRWLRVIRRQIDSCAAFVVVMTPAAEDSEWVDREITRAQQHRKDILPLLLSGSTFFRLSDLHYEDVTTGRLPGDACMARLRSYVLNPASASVDLSAMAMPPDSPSGDVALTSATESQAREPVVAPLRGSPRRVQSRMAAILGTISAFVTALGFGMSSWLVVTAGITLLLISVLLSVSWSAVFRRKRR